MRLRPEEALRVLHLIEVGEIIATLRAVSPASRLGIAGDGEPGVLNDLEDLNDLLDQLELADTAQEARRNLGPIIARLRKALSLNREAGLSEDDAQAVRAAATAVWTVAGDEGLRRTAFVVPYDKEGFAERLKQNPGREFGVDDRWSWLPDDARDDMKEVADCYAIGRYAAAIVFSVRAVESCLRQFYQEIVRDPPGNVPWSRMHNVLKLPVLTPDQEVLSALGVVKKRRDGAMHPGLRKAQDWDAGAARTVIDHCARAIRAMGEDLDKRQAGGGAPGGDCD